MDTVKINDDYELSYDVCAEHSGIENHLALFTVKYSERGALPFECIFTWTTDHIDDDGNPVIDLSMTVHDGEFTSCDAILTAQLANDCAKHAQSLFDNHNK